MFLLSQLRVDRTEAGWRDEERAAAPLSTVVLQPPTIVSCAVTGGLNPSIFVVWKFPAGVEYSFPAAVRYYGKANLLLDPVLTPLLGNVSSVPRPGTDEYVLTIGPGLLTNLLGGDYTVGLSTDLGGWESTIVTKKVVFPLLGLPAYCQP